MRSVLVVVAWSLGTACSFSATSGVGGDAGDLPPTVTVGFLAGASLEDERSSRVDVPVQLSMPAEAPVTVAYRFADGTAKRPMDFAASDGTLTFAPGETTQTIPVTIHDDGIDENADEAFAITLASPTGAELGTAAHTVTISANILPRVSFALLSSQASEAAQETFVATLDIATDVPVSVDYVLGGTASAADYDLGAGTLTFPPGTLSQAFTLDPRDDALDEDDETVQLTLAGSVNAAISSSRSTRVHVLTDDDPLPGVSFMGSARTTEEDEPVTLTVVLGAPSGREVTVPFATGTGATASAADFSYGSTAPLVFPAGTTSRTITLAIVDDASDEPPESFTVVLGTPTHATVGSGSFVVTITDDDDPPSVRWNTASRSEVEGNQDASYDYELVLSAPSGKPILVPVAITSDDAEASDYTAPSSVTFDPGQTTRPFRLTIAGDTVDNPSDSNTETLEMSLTSSGLTNAVVGSPNQVTHTIIDDD